MMKITAKPFSKYRVNGTAYLKRFSVYTRTVEFKLLTTGNDCVLALD